MDKFDLLIEKYRKELIEAKKKSIVEEIEEKEICNSKESIDEIDNKSPENADDNKELEVNDFKIEAYEVEETLFGTIKIQIFASDEVYPIQSAYVKVTDSLTEKIIFEGYSDLSGIVDEIFVETPSLQISQSPSNKRGYSRVDILVEHPRFISVKYLNVPVFENVESIQTVQLIPTSINDDDEIVINQSEDKTFESDGD